MPASTRSAAPARVRSLAALRVLIASLSKSARSVEQRTGITNAQSFLLHQLAEHGPQSVGELAVRAKTQASTASIVVSRLVARGLVRKERAADDGRRTSLSLTAAARKVVRAAPKPPMAYLLEALERMTAREARAFAVGLQAVLRELNLSNAEPTLMFEHGGARRRRSAR